jgi:ABC-type uncharacterized transport system permease subunit
MEPSSASDCTNGAGFKCFALFANWNSSFTLFQACLSAGCDALKTNGFGGVLHKSFESQQVDV